MNRKLMLKIICIPFLIIVAATYSSFISADILANREFFFGGVFPIGLTFILISLMSAFLIFAIIATIHGIVKFSVKKCYESGIAMLIFAQCAMIISASRAFYGMTFSANMVGTAIATLVAPSVYVFFVSRTTGIHDY